MENTGLWKYCTPEQSREFLLSLRLLGRTDREDGEQLACLYAVSNHIEKHYHPAEIRKRDGSIRRLLVPDPLLKKIQRNILHNILDQCRSPHMQRHTIRGREYGSMPGRTAGLSCF